MDSLRGLGALAVMSVHAVHTSAALPANSGLSDYLLRLDIAVPMFFTMSGFLLYRPFVAAHLAGDRRPDVTDYGWRRVLRIVPGYWLALTIVAIVIGLGGVFTLGGIPSYYGFAQIYRSATFDGGLVQAWTIAVEVVFYALLPVYVIALQRLLRHRSPADRLRGEIAGVAVLFTIGMAYNVVAITAVGPLQEGLGPILYGFPAYLNQFAVGMALAIWSTHADGRARVGRENGRAVSLIERWPGLPLAVAVAAFLFLVHGMDLVEGPVSDGEWLARHALNTLVAGALLLPTIFFADVRRGAVRKLLSNRALLYLGVISYGFYLYHLAVLTQLDRWGLGEVLGTGYLSYAAWIALGALGSVLLGAASWHIVERRALRQIHRIRAWRAGHAGGGPTAEPATMPAAPGARDA